MLIYAGISLATVLLAWNARTLSATIRSAIAVRLFIPGAEYMLSISTWLEETWIDAVELESVQCVEIIQRLRLSRYWMFY